MSHSPGPWTIDNCRDGNRLVCLIRTPNEAHAFPSWLAEVSPRENMDANAHLVAAAPELIDACEKTLAWMTNPNAYETSEVLSALIGAMSKAGYDETELDQIAIRLIRSGLPTEARA